jgi:cell division protein ZapE
VATSVQFREFTTVEEAYRAKVENGELDADPVQLELAEKLDVLKSSLEAHKASSKSSSLGWLFARKQQFLRGIYIWGSVGRGKSMLMDQFFHLVQFEPKRRVHFHAFMADAQERINAQREAFREGRSRDEDPIPPVARMMAQEARLLCFDEFSITDIADAMIIGRLFKGLFEAGVVVVATSNVRPSDLYKDGLNRQRFIPFLELLLTKVDIFELDARTDYRLEKLAKASVYNAPFGPKSEAQMDKAWQSMTGGRAEMVESLVVKGRKVNVPRSVDGLARFSFSDLCEKPLGAQDYLAIARRYHTVFIDHVPIMELAHRNFAKRFINLIDTLYDRGIKLVMSAAASPHALYQPKSGTEAFEFERTASRLIEMQSIEYLAKTKTP